MQPRVKSRTWEKEHTHQLRAAPCRFTRLRTGHGSTCRTRSRAALRAVGKTRVCLVEIPWATTGAPVLAHCPVMGSVTSI